MLNIERKFWASLLIIIFWFPFIALYKYTGFPDSLFSKIYAVSTVILSIVLVEILERRSSNK